MAANTAAIFPGGPTMGVADLTAATACTTRGPIAHASLTATPCFAVALLPTSTNGTRVDKIAIKAASTSITAPTAAQTVLIWASNGTTGYVVDELIVSALTPSATVPSFLLEKSYANLVLPATWSLWASTTVTTTASTTAILAEAYGGLY